MNPFYLSYLGSSPLQGLLNLNVAPNYPTRVCGLLEVE